VRAYPAWNCRGLSLVPWQIEQARLLTGGTSIRFEEGDFTACPWAEASLDGVWNLESACHAPGPGKAELVREVARILKPGGHWVVADGFLKGTPPPGPLYKKLLHVVSDFWALDGFPEAQAFRQELEAAGLEVVEARDISMRIVPSVLHIPWVTLKYFLTRILHPRRRLTRESRRHIGACVLSPFVGLNRSQFSYMIWVIRRPVS
jgi:SAM-dependent methyltransferase